MCHTPTQGDTNFDNPQFEDKMVVFGGKPRPSNASLCLYHPCPCTCFCRWIANIKHTFFLTWNSTSRTLPMKIHRKVHQDSHLMGREGRRQSKGFPCSSVTKESACSAGDPDSIPGLGGSPGEGNGNPLQYSCLENFTDGGSWQVTVHRMAKSRTWLSD